MRAVISIRRIAAEDVIAKLFADFSSDFIWDLISLTFLLVCRLGPFGFDIFPFSFLFKQQKPTKAASFTKVCACKAPARLYGAHNRAMSEREPAWTFEHSIDCPVSAAFAWRFWTDIRNWILDADVESVEIDRPFCAGARGFTNSKSSGRVEWRVAEVQAGRAVIEFPLTGAVGRFVWTFQDICGGTRITQHCSLDGEQADAYAKAVGPSLETGIPAGMRKLCETMEEHARGNSP